MPIDVCHGFQPLLKCQYCIQGETLIFPTIGCSNILQHLQALRRDTKGLEYIEDAAIKSDVSHVNIYFPVADTRLLLAVGMGLGRLGGGVVQVVFPQC